MLDYDLVTRGADPYADAGAVAALLEALGKIYIPFVYPDTELAAGTSIELVSPVAGEISRLRLTVDVAIGTGGDITVEVNTVAVTGISIAVADSATKGTRYTDVPTGDGTEAVAAGDRIEIQASAAFATAGRLTGILEITL